MYVIGKLSKYNDERGVVQYSLYTPSTLMVIRRVSIDTSGRTDTNRKSCHSNTSIG